MKRNGGRKIRECVIRLKPGIVAHIVMRRPDGTPEMMAAFPVQVTRPVIMGAICWTASIAFFAIQAVAQAASQRPYSLATNLISDLGNTSCGQLVCSPLHSVVNATFIVVGLLHWVGAIASYRAWPRGIRSTGGIVLLCLAGWGLAYAGIFPEDVSPELHRFGALIGLISLNLGVLLLGLTLLQAARGLGLLAISGALTGLLGLAIFLSPLHLLPVGITERIADYPAAAMVVLLGAFILGQAIRSSARPILPRAK